LLGRSGLGIQLLFLVRAHSIVIARDYLNHDQFPENVAWLGDCAALRLTENKRMPRKKPSPSQATRHMRSQFSLPLMP
jgi:hypothetical protein